MDISNLNECFEEACRLKDEDKPKEAIAILTTLNKHYSNDFAIISLMGLIYYLRLEDFTNAEIYLKRATELNKSSELVSATLYHCLLDLGKEEEAMEELDSFLSRIKKDLPPTSLHYRVILADLLQQEYALDAYWHILEKWYKKYPPSFLLEDEEHMSSLDLDG